MGHDPRHVDQWRTDATHMLTPMPLAISMGVGSQAVPFVMPAVENINGQAITLHVKHKGVKQAKDMKGFKFCVPFDYSMHNFLLRYYLAEVASIPIKKFRSESFRRPRWSRICKQETSTVTWRPTPLINELYMRERGSYSC